MSVILKATQFKAKDQETGDYIDVNVVGGAITLEQVAECMRSMAQPVFDGKKLVFNQDGTVTWALEDGA